MREIVLDTETTGLNFRGDDRVIEVGCVEIINYIATKNTLQFYCRTEKEISIDAQKISGISNKFLKDKKTFSEQHLMLLDFIKDDPLIIHNAEFDLGFLNKELNIIGKAPLKNKIIDTILLARKVLNTRIANLDYLCRRFNIDLTKRKLHGALLDAQLLAEIYLELKGGKQITMDLTTKENKHQIFKKNNSPSKNKTTKLITNEEDIASHKLMVRGIKEALWNKYNY
jgi:DNA polymerase-3 subunit epsilon